MKKIAFVCMALVLALGMLGVGFAMWSDTVTINGTVNTGSVSVTLSQVSNDPPPNGYVDPTTLFTGSLDPSAAGAWTAPSTWVGARANKNVGSTDCALSTDLKTINITLDNGYPGYNGSILIDVDNTGTIPVKLVGFTLTGLSQNGTVVSSFILNGAAWNGLMTLGSVYYADQTGELGEFETIPGTHDTDEAYTLTLSQVTAPDGTVLSQIDPGLKGYVSVNIGILQQALQTNHYDFHIQGVFANWNE